MVVVYLTFSKALGGHIGKSLYEDDYLQYALDMLKKAEEKGVKLLLPVDNRIGDDFSNDRNIQIVKRGCIPDGWEGMDIGTETEKIFCDAVKDAKTVVWNGPMGWLRNAANLLMVQKQLQSSYMRPETTTIIGGVICSQINIMAMATKDDSHLHRWRCFSGIP